MMKRVSLAIVVSLLGFTLAPQLAQAQPTMLRPNAVSPNHRYQEAEVVWQRILMQNPDSAQAYYNLGIAQANQSKWQAAIKSYEQAIAIDPNFVHAYCNLGQAQAQQEQYQAAAQSFRRALTLDPQENLAKELLNDLESTAQSRGLDLAIRSESSSL